MITNSITHVLQSLLQYIALIASLLLYRWIKDAFPFSDVPYTTKMFDRYRQSLKKRNTRSWIGNEPLIHYQWIRQLRQKRNLTQEEFAEKIGVDPRTVQRWESGARPQPRHYSMFQQLEQDFIEEKEKDILSSPIRQSLIPMEGKSYKYEGRPLVPCLVLSLILIGLVVFLILRFWLHIL